MPTYVGVIIGVVCALVFGFLGVLMGIQYRKKFAEAEIGSAEQEAKRIIEEGSKVAEQKKKEALIEAKEEILKSKNELDKEIKDRRNEVSRLERRCVSREESLDRKLDQLEKKDESLNQKIKEYEDKTAEVEQIKVQQTEKLEELSGLTAESAKELLIAQVEEQARFEAAQKLIEIEAQLKEDAEEKARNIIALAISRIASDQVAESTVSVVALPNDDMKGRIIGREGRNIRAVETATGVDLIIDDTPEAITISSFDPIRREVARLTLEKLVSDGRIHPTRIEETVEKAKREVESRIKQAGEKAVFETGIHGLNNELVKILGRLMYRTSYGQNVLNHSVEVSYIAGIIADELGVDGTLARRAGLLHDLFLYDRKEHERVDGEGWHGVGHPKIAFFNAVELFPLNDREADMIVNHMFPVTPHLPRYRETWIIQFVDKFCALGELSQLAARSGKRGMRLAGAFSLGLLVRLTLRF